MFVTIEGIEGSGKSTLCSGLSERLRAEGREVFVTREPGGTPVGDSIRRIVLEPGLHIASLTEALLMNAARAQHVIEAIAPALAEGRIVLCDRYADSSLAYQGFGRGLDLPMLRGIIHAATSGLQPDRTFLLDIPVELSRERVAARNVALDRLETERDVFYERVRRGFLELAAGDPRFVVLDGRSTPGELIDRAMRSLPQAAP
ncbi:MAG: dTMP kinase [Vulcanimicrobiaceae bacterium]